MATAPKYPEVDCPAQGMRTESSRVLVQVVLCRPLKSLISLLEMPQWLPCWSAKKSLGLSVLFTPLWPVELMPSAHVMGFLYSCFLCHYNGEGNGTPLQYCCLENPMDGGAWWAVVHGVTKSWTRLSDFTFMHWRRKWQPTPAFLPGESQGRGSLWGHTVRHKTEAT